MNQSIYERRFDIEMQLESIADDRLEFQKELEKAMKLQSDAIKSGTYENYHDVLEIFHDVEWAARKLRETYEDSYMYHKELLEIEKEEALQLAAFKASPQYTALRLLYQKCASEAAIVAAKV